MFEQILINPDQFAKVFAMIIVAGVFLYIIVLSFFQVRQIRILQDKVQTDVDMIVRIITYAYLIIQIILFVIAILFL